MLGKLMKYDMKYMSRVLPWIYLGAIVMSMIFSGVAALGSRAGSDALLVLVILGITPLYLMIIAMAVCSTVYMMIRIYKNMFSDEGYLTFTLPVKTGSIIWSKLLTGAIWNVFGAIATAIVIAIPLLTLGTVLANIEPEFLQSLDLLFYEFSALTESFADRSSVVWYIVNLVLEAAVLLFMTNSVFMLSCCLAQLLNKNRGIASVGIYLGLNFGISVITSIVSGIQSYSYNAALSENAYYTISERLSSSTGVSLVINLLVTAAAIFFSYRIINKRLNMV